MNAIPKSFPRETPASFPFKAGRGNASATIYKTTSRGYVEFKIPYVDRGVRKFHRFTGYGDARERGNAMLGELTTGNGDTITLTSAARASYQSAVAALKDCGVPLELAAIQFAEVMNILDGHGSPAEAARYFVQYKRKTKHVDMTVAKVVEEFIKEKKLARKSDRYLYDLNYRLGKIKTAFASEIATVDRVQIQGFLNALNLGARSHNNFRDCLITLFRFAKKRNYLPAEWNELATVEAITDKGGAIEFYTPAELASILTGAGETLIPFLTIGAFAGLRSAEICRLDWSSVNFETGFITVEAGNAKTAARRTVPITENLAAWLKTRARKSGPVLKQSETGLYAELRELIKETNTKWKDNALRHSFITYRVAESQDVNKTALEAGNSPAMIFRNYRALVTPKDAARWFSIKPDDSAEGKITWLKVA